MEEDSTDDDLFDLAVKLSKASSETESYEDSLIINSAYRKVLLFFIFVSAVHFAPYLLPILIIVKLI